MRSFEIPTVEKFVRQFARTQGGRDSWKVPIQSRGDTVQAFS